jgi:hypothetical protein
MKKTLLLALLLAAACGDAQDDAAADNDTTAANVASDTDTTAAAGASGERRAAAPTQFDPRGIKRGDRFGDMSVAQVQLQPAATESGSSGSVKFSGQTEVVGSYRAHFDYPEVKEPCFWLDVESWAKLPRASNDQRILWFCFSNAEEAIRQLGALGSQARATIVIDDYTTNLSGSDAWDTARLVRVVRKEAL